MGGGGPFCWARWAGEHHHHHAACRPQRLFSTTTPPRALHPQGYRDAQCAWLQLPSHVVARLLQQQSARAPAPGGTPGEAVEAQLSAAVQAAHADADADRAAAVSEPPPSCALSTLLVLWAPRRQTLEVRTYIGGAGWQQHAALRVLPQTHADAGHAPAVPMPLLLQSSTGRCCNALCQLPAPLRPCDLSFGC